VAANNMAAMRAARLTTVFCCLLATAVAVGCGDGEDGTETGKAMTVASRPAPPPGQFPAPEGRSLKEVLELADKPAEVTISPGAMVFYPGANRYPFQITKRDGRPISEPEVAIYFSRVPEVKPGAQSKSGNKGQVAKAQAEALEQPAFGPFPAAVESLATEPAFRSDTTSDDPKAARVVYAAEVEFPSDGEWRMAAVLREDGELSARVLTIVSVGEFTRVSGVGERAPLIHTPTAADVGGDRSQLTTRVPPDTQNEVDYADAFGKEPIVLLFATPQFCQSRVCGSVVDVAEQVKAEYEDEAAFIHMEIYEGNDPGNEVRSQVRAFRLPVEPWLYAIDSDGIIRAAVEGAFGVELMEEAVEAAVNR